MVQVLIGFVSISGQFEEVSAYPVLSAVRSDRTPNADCPCHFSARQGASLHRARMLHAIDL
eukprot:2258613-Pyramimonas_sp.AAC.1